MRVCVCVCVCVYNLTNLENRSPLSVLIDIFWISGSDVIIPSEVRKQTVKQR